MKTKDKKVRFSVLVAIIVIAIIILGFSYIVNIKDNQIYITLYSPIDNYKKVIQTSEGYLNYDKLEIHEVDGYEFVGFYYDSDMSQKLDGNVYLNDSKILTLGYSKIIIKDQNGFRTDISDINSSYLTIKTDNALLTNQDIEKISNLNVKYLDLSSSQIEGNVIKANYFQNNTNLIEIKLPNTIEKVDNSAFKNCYNLENIEVGRNLKLINEEAFYNCLKLENINIENVEVIKSNAFNNCQSLKEISFGRNLRLLETNALNNTWFENIKINSLNENYALKDNILYTIDYKEIIYSTTKILGDVVIEDSVEIINESAFENRTGIKSLLLSSNLKSIKNKAFKKCISLKEVYFKDTANYEVLDEAFSSCENLTKIKFSNGLNILGDQCFEKCLNLKTIEFNISTSLDISNLQSIGSKCFYGCKSLEFFVMPDSVDYIGQSVFGECLNLKIVNLSSRLKEIPSKTFINNYQLTKVVATSNVNSIKSNAFEGCNKLTDISTFTNVNKLGIECFKNCESIDNLIFDEVEIISDRCFYNCYKLKSISLKNVKEIKDESFYACESLVSFNISTEVEEINQSAFKECKSLKEFIGNNDNYKVIDGVLYNSDLTNILIYPNGKLDQTFEIIESVSDLSDCGLNNNVYLKDINVSNLNSVYKSENGILYSYDKTIMYIYPSLKTIKNLTIDEDVKVIKEGSINNLYLEEVEILNSVEEIEKGAFNSSLNIKSLKIPFIGGKRDENKFLGYIFGSDNYLTNYNCVPSSLISLEITDDIYISEYAFYNLCNIEYLKFNDSVNIIERYAFYGNKNLKEIYFEGSLQLIKEKSFYYVNNLKKLTFAFNENIEIDKNSFEGLNYSLEVNVLNNNQHISYTSRNNLKTKFINSYKRSESWKWLF